MTMLTTLLAGCMPQGSGEECLAGGMTRRSQRAATQSKHLRRSLMCEYLLNETEQITKCSPELFRTLLAPLLRGSKLKLVRVRLHNLHCAELDEQAYVSSTCSSHISHYSQV